MDLKSSHKHLTDLSGYTENDNIQTATLHFFTTGFVLILIEEKSPINRVAVTVPEIKSKGTAPNKYIMKRA